MIERILQSTGKYNKKLIFSLHSPTRLGYAEIVMDLWDFRIHGINEILAWSKTLTKKDRAALNQKLDVLERLDYELARGLKLVSKPNQKSGNVLELRASGETGLRPLLCLGPRSPQTEYTLLQGAQVKDSSLAPSDALDTAKQRRSLVDRHPADWRTPHERA